LNATKISSKILYISSITMLAVKDTY
jgi:hypothetical protein